MGLLLIHEEEERVLLNPQPSTLNPKPLVDSGGGEARARGEAG